MQLLAKRASGGCWIVLLSSMMVGSTVRAATLEDFGYQNMKIQGVPALGHRPLVIILLDLANSASWAHSTSYYDNLIFSFANNLPAGLRSVNGFFVVNSHGRFSLTRAGTGLVGPLQLPEPQRTQAITNGIMRGGLAITAAAAAGFDFAPFDDNHDGRVTSDELLVLIFDNLNQLDRGAARWANPAGTEGSFQLPGGGVSINMGVGLMTQRVSFATLCHELSHLLGTKDLYGIWDVTATKRNTRS